MTWTPTSASSARAQPVPEDLTARLRPFLVPAVFAVVAFLAAAGTATEYRSGWIGGSSLFWLDYRNTRLFVDLVGVGLAGSVLLAVRRPGLAIGVATALLVVPAPLLGSWLVAAYIALLGVTYVAARGSRKMGLVALGTTVGAVFLLMLAGIGNVIGSFGNSFDYYDLTRKLQVVGLYAVGAFVAYGVGVAAGTYGSARTKERVLTTKIGQVDAAAAVTAERARMARDLHDVVAHHVSLIAVRAETAPYTIDDPSPQVRTVLDEIAQSARLAMDELRTILGVLRRTDGDEAERAPQPTLAEVRQLVATAEEAGQRVELTWAADPARVNDAVGLVAYRVVQEALTNARSHAPGTAVQIDVRIIGEALHVRVANERLETSSQQSGGERTGGFGLVGLRERVEAVGGQLSAGSADDGGFLVDARFPLGGQS